MRYCDSSSFIGFVQECFDYSRIFCSLYEFWDCFFISLGAKSKNKKKSTVYDYSALNVVDIIWGESVIFSMIELNL